MGEQRPKTSWVWPYFEVRTLPDGETVACCKTCSKTFKHGGSTSNLINHLAKTHKLFPPKGKRSSVNANSSSSPSTVVNVASLLQTPSTTSSLSAASLNHITHPQPQESQNRPQNRSHPLEFLFGTWRGNGRGFFPGINDFEYIEELNITPDEANRGWLYYRQKTWNPAKGNANFHSEMGYIRCPGLGDHVELVLAQPTGIASTEEGRIEGTTVSFRSTKIARSSTAKPPHVTQYERNFRVDVANGILDYNFSMATVDKAMKEHLVASLQKVPT